MRNFVARFKRCAGLTMTGSEVPNFSYTETVIAYAKTAFLNETHYDLGKLLFTFVPRQICMKCSEFLKLLREDGWYPISQSGSHVKLKHDKKPGVIVFPNHGSQELGKGLENKLRKDAGLK